MKKCIKGTKAALAAAMLLLTTSAISGNLEVDNIPKGWTKTGINAKEFIVQLDKGESYSGNNSIMIRSVDSSADGNGLLTVFQLSSAADYRGKRLKLSLYLKGNTQKGHFGVWFQTYDNKQNIIERVYTSFKEADAATAWTESSVVVDIKENVENMIYGLYVNGRGDYWMDSVSIEIVPDDTPLAGIILEDKEQ